MNQSELRANLSYCPETGIFTRLSTGREINTTNSAGYIVLKYKGKQYLGHRLAFIYMTGSAPKYVDHINGNKVDNSWNNLRECTLQHNNYNMKTTSLNTSGVKGVSWHKRLKKWQAYIKVNKKTKSLGYYKDLELAESVVREARDLYHGEFARHA